MVLKELSPLKMFKFVLPCILEFLLKKPSNENSDFFPLESTTKQTFTKIFAFEFAKNTMLFIISSSFSIMRTNTILISEITVKRTCRPKCLARESTRLILFLQ